MFKELMPMLTGCTVSMTVSRTAPDEICVNVIPVPIKGDEEKDPALSTPLSLEGSPEELDQQLADQLVHYVAAHLELSSTLRSAVEEMKAAAKKAKEQAAKKQNSQSAAAGRPNKERETPDAVMPENTEHPPAVETQTASLFESRGASLPG